MAEIPDWVAETHPEHIYELSLYECGDQAVENVVLTRAEYIALKAHLAAMRGYRSPDPTDIGGMETILVELADGFTFSDGSRMSKDIDQIARHVMIARDIYRSGPDLVTFREPELDKLLVIMSEEGYDQEEGLPERPAPADSESLQVQD